MEIFLVVNRSCHTEEQMLQALLRWFQREGRELPWRETRDPYRIWVSEVLLQQTQVVRAIGYYERFLERFPTLEDLAGAQWRSVLSVWRGLGYYCRGRHMLEAAKLLEREYGGELPQDEKSLRALPGVGPYTASAICSFAFGQNAPAVDTNLLRIFQRFYGCPGSQVQERAEALFRYKPRSSRKINYALMDLGALICISRNPRCERCPLQSHCHYARQTPQSRKGVSLNEKRKPRSSSSDLPTIDVVLGCIHRDGKYLLGKRKRSKGGGWEFPGGKREGKESLRAALKREVQEELGIEVSVRPPFHVETFTDANYEWRLHFSRCQILAGREKPIEHEKIAWVPKEKLNRYKMPSANTPALERLSRMRM
jgi:A/G-specific adenine glycosylase